MTGSVSLREPRRSGRPPCCSPEAQQRIRELIDQGESLRGIARILNSEGLSTPKQQAPWDKSHIWRILRTRYMRDLETESINQ